VYLVETLQSLLSVLIWFLGVVLILLILVQGGAGDLSSTFGGGGQLDSTLGVGASRKLGKVTGWGVVVFLVSVLIMAVPSGGSYEAYGAVNDATDDAAVMVDPAVSAVEAAPVAIEAVPAVEAAPAEAAPAPVEAAPAEAAPAPVETEVAPAAPVEAAPASGLTIETE
jgi:protein translocase SecG subunit